ncbi:MAG: hypothetical protein IJC48_11050 [Clostridia bacterium]|nr:hypothetical protein [Clostridia bacterium]MBQ4158788.1 hypothetical protein [Clostridia bacterium]
MDVEMLNQFELYGMSGGVSFMLQNDEGKRFIKKMSDLCCSPVMIAGGFSLPDVDAGIH